MKDCCLTTHISIYIYIYIYIPTPLQEQDLTRIQFFKSEFIRFKLRVFLLQDLLHNQGERTQFALQIVRGRTVWCIPFPKVLALCEMQRALSTIWTGVTVSIFYDSNHYTTGSSTHTHTHTHTDTHIDIYIFFAVLMTKKYIIWKNKGPQGDLFLSCLFFFSTCFWRFTSSSGSKWFIYLRVFLVLILYYSFLPK